MRGRPPVSAIEDEYNRLMMRPKRVCISNKEVKAAATAFIEAVARTLASSNLSSGEASEHVEALLGDLWEATHPLTSPIPSTLPGARPFWDWVPPSRIYLDM